MYKRNKKNNYFFSIWFYIFTGCFLLGVFIMNMGSEVFLTEEGIFCSSDINRLKYLEVDGGAFLSYVLKKRMLSMVIPILLSTTGLGVLAIYGCAVWQGMLAGMTVTAAVVRFGLKGLLLILAGIFPHQFLIFPAMVLLFGWCYDNCRHKYLYTKSGRHGYMRQIFSLLWILFMVFAGCILESYVNPILVSDMLKIF